METLINQVVELLNEKNKNFHEKQQKLEALWSEANDNLSPNMDNQGRLHAPCDGYTVPLHHAYRDEIGAEKFYKKGEYLPIPLTLALSDTKESQYNTRIASVTIEVANKIISAMDDSFITTSIISKGQSYICSFTNLEKCSLYVHGNGSIEKRIKVAVEEYLKSIKPKKEVKEYTGVVVDGKRTVVVEVLNTKYVEFDRGYSTTVTLKMMCHDIEADTTYFGTVPSSIADDIKVGDKVQFTATFSKDAKSEYHGWYSRPSKASIIAS